MTHLRHLDDLLQNARQVLVALKAGDAARLQALTDAREASLAALLDLGDIDPDHPQAEMCQARLEELSVLNAELTAGIDAVHAETGRRLRGVVKGRKGLNGYGDALPGRRGPGARHGRG